MPSAPLFYQPLVQARIAMAKIGDTTVGDAASKQSYNFAFKGGEDGGERQFEIASEAAGTLVNEAQEKVVQFLSGIESIQKSLPGSALVSGLKLAKNDAGWIANRVRTTFDSDPSILDSASPDEAGEMAAKLVEQATKELATGPTVRLNGTMLEVAPRYTEAIRQHLYGEEYGVDAATAVASAMGRELLRAVTPPKPGTSDQLGWLEDSSIELQAHWPGAASRTAKALGLVGDAAAIDKIAETERTTYLQSPKSGAARALVALLGAAGMNSAKADAWDAAYKVLQGASVDAVPVGIAQAIIANAKLGEDQTPYIANRIFETAGVEGNVAGLLAEIEALKNAPKPEPPMPHPDPDPPTDPKPDPPKDDPPKDDPPKNEDPPDRDSGYSGA